MVACFHLREGRRGRIGVGAGRIEDAPVGVVVVDRVRGAVPDQADRARRFARPQVREDAGDGRGPVAHPDRQAPGLALVGRVREEDVVVVRVGDVDGALRSHLDDEEEVRHAARIRGRLRAGIGERLAADDRGHAGADLPGAARDVHGAVSLIDVDGADLADGAGGPGPAVGEPRWRDGAIEQVDGVGSVKGEPLPVVDRHAAGDVPGRVLHESDAPIGRALSRDVGQDQAGRGEGGRVVVRAGDRIGQADRDVDVAAAIPADCGGLAVGEGVRLPPIDRVAHVRIVGRARRAQVEVPEVHARRHAADAGHVGIAGGVRPAARLAVAAGYRSLQAHARAEGEAALDVAGSARDRFGLHRRGALVLIDQRRDGEVDDVHGIDARAGRGRIDRRMLAGLGSAVRRDAHHGTRVRILVDVEIVVVRRVAPLDRHGDELAGIVRRCARHRQREGVAAAALDAGSFVRRCRPARGAGPGQRSARRADGSRAGGRRARGAPWQGTEREQREYAERARIRRSPQQGDGRSHLDSPAWPWDHERRA